MREKEENKENKFRRELILELEKRLKEKYIKNNVNFLILPEVDRWDIAVFACKNGISQFLAGIELKVGLVKVAQMNVKFWYSKHGKHEIANKRAHYLGTIKRFRKKYYHQNGDPFGQAVTYYIYSHKKPKKVLVLEKDSDEFRLVNITGWAKMCDCLVGKNRNLCELEKEKVEQILNKKREFNSFTEIVSAVLEYVI